MEKIRKYITNPYIQFSFLLLGTVIAFLAWRFPIVSQVKSLKIGIVSNLEPVNIAGGIKKDNIKIYYQEREIKHLRYISFRIQNNGNTPIVPQDFVDSLSIKFPDGFKIFDFSLNPPYILTAHLITPNILKFDPGLLNPGDNFDVEFIIEGNSSVVSTEEISLSGRIVGINDLYISSYQKDELLSDLEKKTHARKKVLDTFKTLGYSLLGIIFIVMLISLSEYKGQNNNLLSLSKAISILVGTIVILFVGGALITLVFLALKTIIQAI
jgi:hypothetical protein